jgi:hypothetical protein
MNEDYVIEIKMPLEKRKKLEEEYAKMLDQFKNLLQANFGTCNIQAATAMAVAQMTAEIAINVATFGIGLGKLLGGEGMIIEEATLFGAPSTESYDLPFSEVELKYISLDEQMRMLNRLRSLMPSKTPEQIEFFVEILEESELRVGR